MRGSIEEPISYDELARLPQYMFQFSDRKALVRALKLLIISTGNQEACRHIVKYFQLFFGVKLVVDISSLFASEYEDGDILLL